MTKLSGRFARSVASHLDSVQVISDLIILVPTRHLVRGLTFERTLVKNDYYVWKLLVPLFSPLMVNLSLNYSDRINVADATGPIYINPENKALVHDAAELFRTTFEPRVGPERDLPEFLRMVDDMKISRSNMMLEAAIAHGINGNFDEACRRLEVIMSLTITSAILPRVQEIAREVRVAIDLQDESFSRLVQTWEQRNTQVHFPGLLMEK